MILLTAQMQSQTGDASILQNQQVVSILQNLVCQGPDIQSEVTMNELLSNPVLSPVFGGAGQQARWGSVDKENRAVINKRPTLLGDGPTAAVPTTTAATTGASEKVVNGAAVGTPNKDPGPIVANNLNNLLNTQNLNQLLGSLSNVTPPSSCNTTPSPPVGGTASAPAPPAVTTTVPMTHALPPTPAAVALRRPPALPGQRPVLLGDAPPAAARPQAPQQPQQQQPQHPFFSQVPVSAAAAASLIQPHGGAGSILTSPAPAQPHQLVAAAPGNPYMFQGLAPGAANPAALAPAAAQPFFYGQQNAAMAAAAAAQAQAQQHAVLMAAVTGPPPYLFGQPAAPAPPPPAASAPSVAAVTSPIVAATNPYAAFMSPTASSTSSSFYTPPSSHPSSGTKRKLPIPPSPEASPDGPYIGQHSQGIGGHYADSYWRKRAKYN